ncbi:MAG: hypothetical protein SV253_03935 [Halobacteria archaeon]|nr:hypothetical protein [Halobacteria archaeon]
MSSASREMDEEVSNIESYDTDDGTVLYDARNPLAWIKSDSTVVLDEQV